MTDTSDSEWLHLLPKVELHCHLEGSMSPSTVKALAAEHQADFSGVWDGVIPDAFSFEDFPDFGRQYLFGLRLLRSNGALVTAIDDLAETLASQHVRHAELTTTAYSHFHGGMSREHYREELNEGRRLAASRGVSIGWVVDIPRDLEMPDSTDTIDFLEGSILPDGIVGIGLGGYEVGFPAAPYAEHFRRGRALGLASLPHAGETEGADSVRQAIDDLGAVRIGHGIRALEDPQLVQRIADAGIFCEVCPTSNLLLGVVDDLADHPFQALRNAGVKVCLNTDDPGWFDTDLFTELEIGSNIFGLSRADHVQLQLDALTASFASDDVKAAVRTELTAL
ncbi:adenosine deaminase [uncultured Ilumatobacter sp.]|uniref:adenosine deaminase n=1 Tax=uncultured Ilumatobacter sp. TaxID=879968 RepID=UPI00374F6F0A